MTRRFSVLIAFTLLVPVLVGCSGNAAVKEIKKGEDFQKRSDWGTAIACYSEAIRLKPDMAEAYRKRAHAYHMKDEFDLAIRDYTEAIRLEPDYFYSYGHRAYTYSRIGDHDSEIKDRTESIRLDLGRSTTSTSLLYAHRGIAYQNNDEHDKAIADFTEAIRLNPDSAYAYFGRSGSYEDIGDQAKADADAARSDGLKAKK